MSGQPLESAMKFKRILAASIMLCTTATFAAGVNNCEKQVARYKALCEKEPGATNMDACFNYKVFSRWCGDPSVTPQNQPVKACEARSAVIREEAGTEKDAGLKKQRLQQAEQNDQMCAMLKNR